MLYFEEYDGTLNCREFGFHGDTDIFHKALKAVSRGGERRFHVIDPEGGNFDLVYRDNDYEMKQAGVFNTSLMPEQFSLFSPFLNYDENKSGRLYLDFLEEFDSIYFTRLNEYTVVLCKVLLENTGKKLFFKDGRIRRFFSDERITVTQEFPQGPGPGYLLVTPSFFEQDPVTNRTLYDINLFSTVFCIDAFTDLDIDKIKYVSLYIDRMEGIGAILINFLKVKKLFEKFGFEICIKENTSRYSDRLLRKYFKVGGTPPDSDETNTIFIPNYFGAVFTLSIDKTILNSDLGEVLNEEITGNMEEYRQAVLGGKKVLGLMVRGTDYQKSKINVQPIAMERLISIVRDRLDSENFDRVFLATEDKDKLDELVRAFPDKIVTVAQERFSLKDFTEGINLISELEKKNRTPEEHEASLEDTTVNYFYAIYILTKCDAFIATPFTNGVRCVLTFNKNAFSSTDILSDTI